MNEKNDISQILVKPVEVVQSSQLVSETTTEATPANEQTAQEEILQPSEIQPPSDVPINLTAEPVQASELIEKRGRGRPKGSKNKMADGSTISAAPEIQPQSAPVEAIPAAPVIVEVQTDYRQLSLLTCDMGSATLSVIFGDEWRFEDEQERESIAGAVEHYFKAKQVKDIPPGALLCIVVSTYAAKRFQKPKTANKIKLGWYWLKNKFSRKKKPADVVAMPAQS